MRGRWFEPVSTDADMSMRLIGTSMSVTQDSSTPSAVEVIIFLRHSLQVSYTRTSHARSRVVSETKAEVVVHRHAGTQRDTENKDQERQLPPLFLVLGVVLGRVCAIFVYDICKANGCRGRGSCLRS